MLVETLKSEKRVERSPLLMAILLAVFFITLIYADPKDEARQEYLVKAAFLYNFAKFVTWPDGAFQDSSSPLSVCIFGDDPFKQALKSIRGKGIKGRVLKVHQIRSLSDIGSCHILFIAPSERYNLSKIITAVGSNHTLTVGDMEHFSEKGGMINLIKVDNKIKFEINLRSARKAGLKISSKILKLAKVIRNDT